MAKREQHFYILRVGRVGIRSGGFRSLRSLINVNSSARCGTKTDLLDALFGAPVQWSAHAVTSLTTAGLHTGRTHYSTKPAIDHCRRHARDAPTHTYTHTQPHKSSFCSSSDSVFCRSLKRPSATAAHSVESIFESSPFLKDFKGNVSKSALRIITVKN